MARIAVLGCGRIGRMHADNIAAHPRAALAGVFDISPPAAAEVAHRLGVTNFPSAAAVFAAPDVDAVLIATSTATHADLLEQALAQGKPVLCEKPIDLSLARVEACARAISGYAAPVMLGFVRRFDPGHRALRDSVRAGTIGELQQLVITSRDPGLASSAYIEASGGIFRDMTIHDFDMARFVLGEDPHEVTAVGSRLVDEALMTRCQDWDTVSVILRTPSGKQCLINNSRRAVYGYDQRVEAFGSAGLAVSENRRAHMMRISGARATDCAAPLLDFFIDRYAEAFAAEIGAFVDVIETGKAPEVGFEDGRLALLLAEAAIRSAAEGRTVGTGELG